MQVSIVQDGRVLRQIVHGGEVYVEAPPSGEYRVRLYNSSPSRREAVISVDGINVLDGKDAGFSGPGYVLTPWQTVEIPGWSRGKNKVAAFTFEAEDGSYAAKTGRGTRNVGVIGVAVFEERVRPQPSPLVIKEHPPPLDPPRPRPRPVVEPHWGTTTTTVYGAMGSGSTNTVESCMDAAEMSLGDTPRASLNSAMSPATKSIDVGTAYGRETDFHTLETAFERASAHPVLVVQLRYATTERLRSWGVPVDSAAEAPSRPSAFPAEGCPAPVGWRG